MRSSTSLPRCAAQPRWLGDPGGRNRSSFKPSRGGVGDAHDEDMMKTRPGSISGVIGADDLTGTARTAGLLYLGLAVTGALGFQLVAASSTLPTIPEIVCDNPRRFSSTVARWGGLSTAPISVRTVGVAGF